MDDIFNGIDGATGRYLPLPGHGHLHGQPPLDPRKLREYKWWTQGYGIDDPNRAPVQSVDPLKLEEAGWGVIFAEGTERDVIDALQPLLTWRKEQAGAFYKEYTLGSKMTKLDFLEQHDVGTGPADPRKVPYYLLIVGSPAAISFRFQYDLDVQYAVGRLHFETAKEYANYAGGVLAAKPRPRRLMFFGVENPDDGSTQATTNDLIIPLSGALDGARAGWESKAILGVEATKSRLRCLLGREETPALLFSACHGMAFEPGHQLFRERQGALLCQDWPGPKALGDNEPIPESMYLSADDIDDDACVKGMIAFHLACYSAGTPEIEDFVAPTFGRPGSNQAGPFLARLPQRLLGHPNGGALAVLGHVDRAWTMSFGRITRKAEEISAAVAASKKAPAGQIGTYESVILRLLENHPVGSAMEFINQRFAELSVELSGLFADREKMIGPSRSHFERIWRANDDARNFVVLGDPAVRLQGASPAAAS